MNIRLDFTPFRRMMRPLLLYSAKDRSSDANVRMKWIIGEDIQIRGYHHPDGQKRLTNIRLNTKNSPVVGGDSPEFFTEIPTINRMGIATGRDNIMIVDEPGQDYIKICTDDLRYKIAKIPADEEPTIAENYIPMENIELSGSISVNKLQKIAEIAPESPLRLKIRDNTVKFVSNDEMGEMTADLTDNVMIHSNNGCEDYLYNPSLLAETLKKFPRKEEIELFVNKDVIRLRYELGDGCGQINHYQRGIVDTSQSTRYYY